MAFLTGIFGKPQQQQQQPQGQQVQHPNQPQGQQGEQGQQQQYQPNQNQNGSGGPAGSQQTPQNSNYQGAGGNPANPLDPFLKLMTPDPKMLEQQQQQQQPAGLFGDGFSPENVNKALSGNNFTGSVDPAKMQAALGGDVNAFTEVLNAVAMNAASMSIQASKGMVEHGVKTGTEQFGSGLDSRFREYELRNQTPSNEVLKHPVGKAMHSIVAKQIATANPRMSPSEVNQKAEQMFMEFGKMLNPGQQQGDQNQQGQKGTDWNAFLDIANQ